jgi:hypothetical protein
MGLGIANTGGEGGEILDRVEYDARAGRLFRVDRSQGGDGNWVTDKVELRLPVTLVMDFENIEVGWVKLDKIAGVDFRMVRIGENIGPRPEGTKPDGKPLYRQGFRVKVYSQQLLSGVRVLAHTAQCVIGQVDLLHNAWAADAPKNPGKVPVVTLKEVMPVKSGQSTNYAPIFTIDKWIDRPAALTAKPMQEAAEQGNGGPAPTGSGHTPPPGAVQQKVVQSNGTEF